MNAYTCYHSMSIIIVRKLRLNDICGEQCLHPFASRSSFELHFNPFLCNKYTFLWRLISISIFIRIFVFCSCTGTPYIHYLWTPLNGDTVCVVCKRAVRSNIIWNEELCENTHIYYKKALEPWLRIVCLKTNMEKGLFVFAICGCVFLLSRTQCHTFAIVERGTHTWTTPYVNMNSFITISFCSSLLKK